MVDQNSVVIGNLDTNIYSWPSSSSNYIYIIAPANYVVAPITEYIKVFVRHSVNALD